MGWPLSRLPGRGVTPKLTPTGVREGAIVAGLKKRSHGIWYLTWYEDGERRYLSLKTTDQRTPQRTHSSDDSLASNDETRHTGGPTGGPIDGSTRGPIGGPQIKKEEEGEESPSPESEREDRIQAGEPLPEAVMKIFDLWEKASGRIVSSLEQEAVQDDCTTFGAERVEKAIRIAAKNGATSWSYVQKVLRTGGDKDQVLQKAGGYDLSPLSTYERKIAEDLLTRGKGLRDQNYEYRLDQKTGQVERKHLSLGGARWGPYLQLRKVDHADA
jgi:DnaD/phage-associated family protein